MLVCGRALSLMLICGCALSPAYIEAAQALEPLWRALDWVTDPLANAVQDMCVTKKTGGPYGTPVITEVVQKQPVLMAAPVPQFYLRYSATTLSHLSVSWRSSYRISDAVHTGILDAAIVQKFDHNSGMLQHHVVTQHQHCTPLGQVKMGNNNNDV